MPGIDIREAFSANPHEALGERIATNRTERSTFSYVLDMALVGRIVVEAASALDAMAIAYDQHWRAAEADGRIELIATSDPSEPTYNASLPESLAAAEQLEASLDQGQVPERAAEPTPDPAEQPEAFNAALNEDVYRIEEGLPPLRAA